MVSGGMELLLGVPDDDADDFPRAVRLRDEVVRLRDDGAVRPADVRLADVRLADARLADARLADARLALRLRDVAARVVRSLCDASCPLWFSARSAVWFLA